MNKIFKRATIIGAGLIGGSLAQAIKENKAALEVVGYFRKESSLNRAKKCNFLDGYYRDLNKAVSGSDLILLATPVYSIISIGKKIKDFVLDDAVITDVGSTKKEVVAQLGEMYPNNFLGAHPLAGSEKKGIENADPKLFQDKVVILTPTSKTPKIIIKKLRFFWKSLGANVVTLDSKTHDKVLSKVSHLPHILMYPLLDSLTKDDLKFTASGFRDATRIAVSDSKIWSDIILSNRVNIIKDIDSYIKKLQEYKRIIEGDFKIKLQSRISKAATKRRQLK